MRNFFKIFMSVIFTLIFVSEGYSNIRRAHTKVAELSLAEASERWGEFSSSRFGSDYVLDFVMKHLPRKAQGYSYNGTIYGMQRGDEVFMRIVFNLEHKDIEFLLISADENSKVYRYADEKLELLDESDWTKPFIEGLIYTPFDLLMPFKKWPVSYDGAGRIGQAVHFYKLSPPEAFRTQIGALRIALSREFNSPVSTQVLDENLKLIRTLDLSTAKKIDGFWIMLEASLRDENTRDKDKLIFTSGKMNLKLPEDIFKPQNLSKKLDKPLLESF